MSYKQKSGKTTRSTTQNGGEQGQEEQHGQDPPQTDNLLAEVIKIGSTLQTVAVDVTSIKTKLTELTTAVTAVQERVTEAETRISSLEDTTERLRTAEGKRSKLFESMWDRIQALENHGKRNNVRVIGLKEALGADGTLLSCVQKMLAEGLGINAAAPEFEIEHAHRALASLPDPDKPPRPVLVRFLRQSARDKVIAAAKVKGGFEWEKCRVSVFPDMTKELEAAATQCSVHPGVPSNTEGEVEWEKHELHIRSCRGKFFNKEANDEETTATE
ncbi:hypothetical protein WMY93_029755 [Mugilogobius chulae]|uniref:L1 transposable element RRM domain-containing protein n=1 Tax=Mugilogobius chulae TaxID=88201 RepID=A0AAW0MXK8_9GOBI